jgi:hypothetical protein
MAAATTMKRSAFGNVTNKGSELDRDEKRHHASTEGQLAEAPPSEEASSLAEAPESLSEWPEEETYRCAKANCGFGGIITGDQPAAVCDKCGDLVTGAGIFHVRCAGLNTAPDYYTCPGCKAEEDAEELAALKKNGDSAFGEKPAPKKRKTADGGGSQKRMVPEGGSRGQRPSEMPPAKRAAHKQAMADKKTKKKAEGADELEAAAAALKAHDLYKKKNYQAILAEVENWAKRGGTVLTAAKWIRCLMSEGDDRLTPSRVRLNYKKVYPYAA